MYLFKTKKCTNAQLEHIARKAEIVTNRGRFEFTELSRLERCQFKDEGF